MLIHLIQVVGEAARQVSREFADKHPEIPWTNIIGMRHKVVYDYLGVDEDIVWQVVTGCGRRARPNRPCCFLVVDQTRSQSQVPPFSSP